MKAVGTGALAAAFPATIQRALAIPARYRTGTLADVEHIVFLMQENRSFDHYFGTLRGVRGFGDPHPMRQPNDEPVWRQADGNNRVLPFHPDAPNLGLQFLEDLPHGWTDTHNAWNAGRYDQWIPNKGKTTMAYLTRADIPFYYALADAFTVCDAYHCSFLGATDPNRYHMWTGWVGNDGQGGGPVVDNSEAGYDWHTFPERLTRAGISWKVYQDAGAGLDAEHFWGWGDDAYIGNYGDNSLLYVISPWSKGGWVNSELFDHTSLIRFVERRFGHEHPEILETNITAWRRAVAGDLTSAFDFKQPNAAVVSLPNTDGYVPTDDERHPDYVPALPASPSMPKQEPGVRPARAVPYLPSLLADVDIEHGSTMRTESAPSRSSSGPTARSCGIGRSRARSAGTTSRFASTPIRASSSGSPVISKRARTA